MIPRDDTVDLREVGATLRREKRWLWAGVLLGLAAAGGVLVFVRPSYEGNASALLQADADRTPSALALLGGIADALPTDGLGSAIETELQLLTSRSVYGTVIDSLHLQARVLEPHDVSAAQLFSDARFEAVPPEASYTFSRTGNVYTVRGDGHRGEALPGTPYQLPGAEVTLRTDLPDEFRIQLLTREEAIDRMQEDLLAEQAGGDVAQLVYNGDDPTTAAAVPNAVIDVYLQRKKTTDRGINQYRYEFLRARADSVAVELADAAESLRQAQERTGVIDPMLNGEYQLEAAMTVRQVLTQVQVELEALQRVMADESLSGAALASFPTLLESPAMNELVALLGETEAAREALLERRTPEDPEVVALTRTVAMLEGQMAELARGYLQGLREQEVELLSEYNLHQTALAALPAQAKENLQLQREVERLAQTELILQTQLIDARLAAIGEGGNVRQIDVAVPPQEPSFPQPLPTVLIGLFGGVLVGLVGALGKGFLGQRIRHEYEVELAAGIPAVAFQRNAPLLLGGLEESCTALLVPLGANGLVEDVAHQLAGTAQLRGKRAAVVDLTGVAKVPALAKGAAIVAMSPARAGEAGSSALAPYSDDRTEGVLVYRVVGENATAERIRTALDQLEEQNDLVVAIAPQLDEAGTAALLSPRRLVILVAAAGQVTRPELQGAVRNLGRLGISVPGVVLTKGA